MADFDEDDPAGYAPVYDGGWHTVDTARVEWQGGPFYDAQLRELLEVAKHQVLEYAPVLRDDDADVPASYRAAQLMQARNIWNASKADAASGGEGTDTFVLRPFPLDWMVRQLLRPKRGVPVVG